MNWYGPFCATQPRCSRRRIARYSISRCRPNPLRCPRQGRRDFSAIRVVAIRSWAGGSAMNHPAAQDASAPRRAYPWPWVLCLLGVDYFSTLAYQPSMTYQLAGRLGPLATLVVILVTLGGALPVYWYVAGKSPRGEGSIAMLERLVRGWRGKSLVLLLLGFAATDFVMVKTISVADAAVHVIGNQYEPWQDTLAFVAEWSKAEGKDF